MKNPIRIRTNQIGERYFDVYLYEDRKMFESDEDEIMRNEEIDLMYSGISSNLFEQRGKIDIGTKVTFREEGSLDKIRQGRVVKFHSTPFLEIKEDITNHHFGIHRKYVKSVEPTFRELSEMYIQKLGNHQYRKYDLGAVKLYQTTFLNSEDSLADLASKGNFIIMISSKV